ncbi:MAG TPA: glycogen synthase GlgA [Steroidobacteraceae bacterium]|nr:glycogen synthase GlgA [Steroidobacteraceae bacterium]
MLLRICSIASEVTPLAKTGGLADVTSALLGYLHREGHEVRGFLPLYASIDREAFESQPVDGLGDLPLEIGPHRLRYSVLKAHLPGSRADIYLIDCPALYARPRIYTHDADEHVRFLALTRAALECCQRTLWSPHIVHCHDWHAAFGPLYLKTLYSWDRLFQSTRSVLTIHNIGYQGTFSAAAAGDLQLGWSSHLLHQDDLRSGVINPLKHGILYADAVTTVSPTYAEEIRTPEYGMGLEDTLAARADSVVGILNGVDYAEWDPRTDRYLEHHYDATRLDSKMKLKTELAARLGLSLGPRTALAGIVTRLATQKGIDLLIDVLPGILAGGQLVCTVLGRGEERYERALAELQDAFPGRLAFHRGYDEALAHWIEGASDLYLMPSRYEPCGLNQMYSLRYGTVPVVRETGGLADSVERYDPASGRGTGIVFKEYSAAALTEALHLALDLYAAPAHWTRIVRNGMAKDFSWTRQGTHYVELYERLARIAAAVSAG